MVHSAQIQYAGHPTKLLQRLLRKKMCSQRTEFEIGKRKNKDSSKERWGGNILDEKGRENRGVFSVTVQFWTIFFDAKKNYGLEMQVGN